MKLRVLYHGNCFDGMASAAYFSKFYHGKINPEAKISYAPTMHRAGNAFDRDELFTGDENAIVDFKFCADDRLTWWFDHHESAFLSAEDEAYYQRRNSPQHFLDTSSKSCCEFIARIAHEKYGFTDPMFDSLVSWAHTIDGAFYETAAQVVELREPALQLMQVIEGTKDAEFFDNVIRALMEKPLNEVATSDSVQSRFKPILDEHLATLDAIKRKAVYSRGVVNFDLVEFGVDGFNKFIPYYLHPQTTYSVALTRSTNRAKVSVGSNPWSPRPRLHNIAKICERYGGGGHAVVGAVSLAPDAVDRAREIVGEIVEELQFATD